MCVYQSYHKHSMYSNIITPDSPVAPEAYAKRAVELGHNLLSSVEHGTCGRYIEYYELAKKYNLKYIFGLESYIVKDRLEKDNTNAHIILLAKNENGRKSINRIVSQANMDGFYYKARIDLSLLDSLSKNDVWITTACIGGLWKYENADEIILNLAEKFQGSFFLEVQNHNVDSQKQLNSHILNMSNQYNIPIIFGCDSHFIYPEQFTERNNFLLSKHIVYEDEANWFLDYPSNEEAEQRFIDQGILNKNQIKESMNNTNVLLNVEEYTSDIFQTNVKLPSLYPDKTQREKNDIFTKLISDQWEKEKINIPKHKHDHYEKEIAKEVETIVDTGMTDYFLIDYAIVKLGKEKGGSITLTGRGSAPSYFITKLLGLTTIDRISSSVKLFPERFITKERILETGSIPDIDLNLGTVEIFAEAQSEVMGLNHSFPMIAYGTMQILASWKMYARAKNVEFEIANDVSSQIESYEFAIKHAEEDEKEDINILDYISEEYKDMYLESSKYLGIISDAKIHPCAYLLSDKDIIEEIGIIKVKENICCLMDGLWAEKFHLLKNDLLKVKVVDLISQIYKKVGIEPLPLDKVIEICNKDKSAWDVYKNGWVMGINQVEQHGTASRASKYAPTNISELSALVAAVRPGFKSNYKQFESREPFCYGIKSLDDIVQTKEFPQSYLIYQENAMQVMNFAGIPISQTYEIIKNIAKKRVEKVLKYKEQFIEGMKNKISKTEKISKEESEKIANMTWQIIEDSSRYSFNAAHAYSVAGDSLIGAYLKMHYPLAFYEVFLNLIEKEDKDRYNRAKDEAQRAFHIKFPPIKFGQDNRQIISIPEKNEITASLASIKGFGSAIGEQLYQLSQNKYESFLDFLITAEESSMFSSKFSDLIKINYFDCFGNNKKLQLVYDEFTSGKLRYSKTHSQNTKDKRYLALVDFEKNIPNERFPITQQLQFELSILGNIQATYPIDKRYIFILELDTKYSPRIQAYCMNNGMQMSLKLQKKLYERNPFGGGEILYAQNFEKKECVKFDNGKYVSKDDGSFDWWISNYRVIKPSEFDSILV